MKLAPFLFCLFLCGCFTESKIVRLDGSRIEKETLSARIQTLVDTAEVTGIAIAIFNNNETVFKKAFGYANYEKKDSLQTDQTFYGASLSKAVFGYLVAGLAAEGIIDLDKPLQDYLDVPIPDMKFEKEWRGFKEIADDKRYEKITARMCLSHTTGLPNWRWVSRSQEFQPEGKLHFLF